MNKKQRHPWPVMAGSPQQAARAVGGSPSPERPARGHTSAPAAVRGPRAVIQGFRTPASRAVGQATGRVGTEPGAVQEQAGGSHRV